MRLLLLQVGDAPPGSWPLTDGRADPPLSATGHDQAAAAADRLRDLPVEAIYLAPSLRAGQTGHYVSMSRDCRTVVLPGLAEIFHGTYEGRNFRDLAVGGDPVFKQFRHSRSWDAFADGEGDAAFRRRCRLALEQILSGAPPGAIRLVVSHGGVLNAIVAEALALPFSMSYMPRGGSLSCLVYSETKPVCLALNDCRHLPEDPLLDQADPILA